MNKNKERAPCAIARDGAININGGKMKYRVAVVDDERETLDGIIRLLNNYTQSHGNEQIFESDAYLSGDEFFAGNPNSYEIVFLDINMPGINGLSVARKIREQNKTAVIIFCTHYAQYAVNGYEVNALGYLVKPLDEKLFNRNIDRVIKALLSSQSRRIRIKTLHGVEIVPASELLYLEIQIHNLYYYVLGENNEIITYRTRGSMQEMEKQLSELDFARCSACYLVNLRRIISVVNGEVRLNGGASLPISRKYLRSFSDNFMKFLGCNGTINV